MILGVEWPIILAYCATVLALVVVPGPTVTVIIANSLRSGTKAGFANIAGTQVGLSILLMLFVFGFSSVMAFIGEAFFWLKLIGAAYLIWLGISLWRSQGNFAGIERSRDKVSMSKMFWQGFFVILSNPKVLFFFGALVPQFIEPSRPIFEQTIFFCLAFMVLATLVDGLYALLAGGAGQMLTAHRVRLAEKLSGSFLILGGVWMALSRKA